MTTGLYLYCLRDPVGNLPETCRAANGTCPAPGGISSPGVNGGGVSIRVCDGVEAVVSAVNLDDFEAIQRKAQEDVQWIKEKALAHEMVVEEAMGKMNYMNFKEVGRGVPAEPSEKTAHPEGSPYHKEVEKSSLPCRPVIPVKFGVIFKTDARLAQVIGERNAVIKAAFDRIRAKEEWSIKLFLKDNRKFKDQIREQSEQLSGKNNALASLPAGLAYFMEEELNADLERECSRRLDEQALKLYEELKPFAAEATLVKLLDGKLTGRSERMILNAAYLVADSHMPEFESAIAQRRERLAPAGFLLEQSGPWPAYHFTEFAHE